MLPKNFKPMLAAGKPRDWSDDQWLSHFEKLMPLIASPKIDGIRCICSNDGFPVSRSLKDIPNGAVRAYFFKHRGAIKPCFDGELLIGGGFQKTTSGIMSFAGDPEFDYWIFDIPMDAPFEKRVDLITELSKQGLPSRFRTVPQGWIETVDQLLTMEENCLAEGYEGVMLRTPDSPYKYGRSTAKQGYLMKLKRFETAEAVVVGFEPLMRNNNEAKINELGYQARSHSKCGMVADETLGRFVVRGINCGFDGIEFRLGSGLNQAQRDCFWENKEKLIGKVVEYKYQNHGIKDAPRTPIFLRFRDAKEF